MILIIVAFFLIIIIISIYQKSNNAMCKSDKLLTGQTTLVTGGTSGLGFQIAKDFARRGARVIVACPFEEEGRVAEKEIINETANPDVVFKFLDLSSLKSVRKFADDIIKNEERLDILVNNAGVGIPCDFMTNDGMHFIMQVNYYGHFLLTLLLLPLLKKSGSSSEPARIINMSSLFHRIASFDIDNYNRVGYWFRLRVYNNSKLSLVLFSRELSRRLKGSNVVVNCADPGYAATRIYKSREDIQFFGQIAIVLIFIFFKTVFQGAQTAIFMAVDEAGKVSGEYFANCQQIKATSKAYDDTYVKKLWTQSLKLVQISDEELSVL